MPTRSTSTVRRLGSACTFTVFSCSPFCSFFRSCPLLCVSGPDHTRHLHRRDDDQVALAKGIEKQALAKANREQVIRAARCVHRGLSIVPTLLLLGGLSRSMHHTCPRVSFPLVPRRNVPQRAATCRNVPQRAETCRNVPALTRPFIKLHQRELQGNLVGVEVGSCMPT